MAADPSSELAGKFRLRSMELDADVAGGDSRLLGTLGDALSLAQILADRRGKPVVVEWRDSSDPRPDDLPAGDLGAYRAWLHGRNERLEARLWVRVGLRGPTAV
jgi:hypothetical protein